MAITIEDVMGAATQGVLRALDARREAAKVAAQPETGEFSTATLVRSGFYVDVHIRAGGISPGPVWDRGLALNPQPLPPGRQEQ